MVFSSQTFLFFFLPLAGLCVLVRAKPVQNALLLIASLIFYAWGEPWFVLVMMASILINYAFGLWVHAPKSRGKSTRVPVVLSVVSNLGLMFVFKYLTFVLRELGRLGLSLTIPVIELPLGISFFTFQGLSYVIDVYRGDAPIQKNPLDTALYVALFPQLVAGPIVRYTTVMEEIAHREETLSEFAAGATRFCFGLSKKIVLANYTAPTAVDVLALHDALPISRLAWAGALAYTFQIYFDFSAYSDMAIGLGHTFGFHFLENFNYPYISRSVTEFWRRWHISLSSWFRDYVYIPLGGNRCSRARQIRNILTVWLLTGLWHGAAWTFILWGLWFCLLLLGEKFLWGHFLEQLPSPIRWACTMLAVILSWVLFRAADLGQAWAYLGAMFGQTTSLAQDGQAVYYLLQFWPEWILALIAFLPVKQWLQSWLEARGAAGQTLALWAPRVLALGLLVLSYGLLVTGSFNPFIYFQF